MKFGSEEGDRYPYLLGKGHSSIVQMIGGMSELGWSLEDEVLMRIYANLGSFTEPTTRKSASKLMDPLAT